MPGDAQRGSAPRALGLLRTLRGSCGHGSHQAYRGERGRRRLCLQLEAFPLREKRHCPVVPVRADGVRAGGERSRTHREGWAGLAVPATTSLPSTHPHTSLDVHFINCYQASTVCQVLCQTLGLTEYKAAVKLLSS